FGNDGGIYRTDDVLAATPTYTNLNNNLGITQFYSAVGNSMSGTVVGGTQDNGTLRHLAGQPTSTWSFWAGADGGYTATDPTDPNYFYGEQQYLRVFRSVNGAGAAQSIVAGLGDAGSTTKALFIAPLILDPNDPNRLLAGGNQLWRTVNPKAVNPASVAWTSIKASASGALISAIAVQPGNSNVIWVAQTPVAIYKTTNGTSATPTWTPVSIAGLPTRLVTRIALFDANTAYVTFGGYGGARDNVWRTTDGGASWTNISSGLPMVPVYSLVLSPTIPSWLYIGT